MRIRDIWRIAALIAVILVTLGLALGACAAKRSSDSGQSSGTTPGKGGSVRGSSVVTPADMRAPSPDAGPVKNTETKAEPKPAPPVASPRPSMATPKGHKGMLGQMHLRDGD